MKAIITKVKKEHSKYGDIFYYVFFKDKEGQNYKSCIYTKMRNYKNWTGKLKVGLMLDNLRTKLSNKKLIDADSEPKIYRDLSLMPWSRYFKNNPNQQKLKL
tara:strand:+ start:452 stop:757 length:306 start_codon:yes stop_codon:yes gene_type:complete